MYKKPRRKSRDHTTGGKEKVEVSRSEERSKGDSEICGPPATGEKTVKKEERFRRRSRSSRGNRRPDAQTKKTCGTGRTNN